MGGAERFQADGWLAAVAQWRPLAAGWLRDTQTLHVQDHGVHTSKTGLSGQDTGTGTGDRGQGTVILR